MDEETFDPSLGLQESQLVGLPPIGVPRTQPSRRRSLRRATDVETVDLQVSQRVGLPPPDVRRTQQALAEGAMDVETDEQALRLQESPPVALPPSAPRTHPEALAQVRAKESDQALRLEELTLVNFKSYAGTVRVAPFDPQLVVVVGPNGASKSCLI